MPHRSAEPSGSPMAVSRQPSVGRGRFRISGRFSILLGVMIGAVLWELWQASTGWGALHYLMRPHPPAMDPSAEGFTCETGDERSEVCHMVGDVRFELVQTRLVLFAQQPSTTRGSRVARPHPLKQVTSHYQGPATLPRDEVQERIHADMRRRTLEAAVAPVLLSSVDASDASSKVLRCSRHHRVPLVLFSTGGYNGNAFHTFVDGLIPLFITTQHYHREVVLGIVDHQTWWLTKFAPLLSELTRYPLLLIGHPNTKGPGSVSNWTTDPAVHCFRDVTVGLRIHTPNLCIDPRRMPAGESNHAFARMVQRAYGLAERGERVPGPQHPLVLGMVHRERTRRILNEAELLEEARRMGFSVRLLSEALLMDNNFGKAVKATYELDALIGVHGAGLTQMVLLPPGSVLVQIVPVGTEWVSESDFGECARKARLHYVGYNASRAECTLIRTNDGGSEVFTQPSKVWKRGWKHGEEVYLGQDVQLDPVGLRGILGEVYDALVGTRTNTTRPPKL